MWRSANVYLISTEMKLHIKKLFAVNKVADGGIYVNTKRIYQRKKSFWHRPNVCKVMISILLKTFKLKLYLTHKTVSRIFIQMKILFLEN
jgi:hypothetical protein